MPSIGEADVITIIYGRACLCEKCVCEQVLWQQVFV